MTLAPKRDAVHEGSGEAFEQEGGDMDWAEKKAAEVTKDLFRSGAREEADRLVLTVDGPPKRDLGGWGRPAVRDRIAAALREARGEKDTVVPELLNLVRRFIRSGVIGAGLHDFIDADALDEKEESAARRDFDRLQELAGVEHFDPAPPEAR